MTCILIICPQPLLLNVNIIRAKGFQRTSPAEFSPNPVYTKLFFLRKNFLQ